MKSEKTTYLIIFFLLICATTYSQNAIIVDYTNCFLIKNKSYQTVKEKYAYDYEIKNYSLGVFYTLPSEKRFTYSVGFSYRKINAKTIDRITHWNYTTSYLISGIYFNDTIYQVYKDPADLVSESKNVGITNELSFKISEMKKMKHFVGIKTEVYLYEKFNSYYHSDDFSTIGNQSNDLSSDANKPYPTYYGNNTPFNFHSINVFVNYRILLNVTNYVSLAAKLSLGTNLYSDWDQFKKYAWLGVGLEMGFNFKKKQE